MPRPVLPPRARTALILRSCGYSMGEIAGLMGLAGKSGVSSALATAVKNLGCTNVEHAIARACFGGYFDSEVIE